jgi:hypothetical protein
LEFVLKNMGDPCSDHAKTAKRATGPKQTKMYGAVYQRYKQQGTIFVPVSGVELQGAGYIRCSLCRLIRRPGSFSERVIGRHSGIPRQTEGHSFGGHLISESVLRHRVLYKLLSIVLSSVSLWLV